MPTGATVAALTTSLPETPGGERNWDYRYTWLRDSTFTLQALHYLNLDWEAEEFMQFVADLEPNGDGALQIMYGIDGRRDLTESTARGPLRLRGREPGADRQRRLRPAPERRFGAALDSILLHTRRSQRLPRRLWPIVQAQAECATKVWRKPDQGIWEARGKPQHYVSSKLMCWVAMDRAAKLAAMRGDAKLSRTVGAPPPRRSRTDILAHGVSATACCASTTTPTRSTPPTCWRRSSASCPPSDERLRASVLAIAEELTEDGFVLRYRTDETDDGMSGKEGSFLICSFWLVSGLAVVGEDQRARDLMERLLRVASPLGLYAEEFDTSTGRHLGNFPQAFSHLALIEAAGAHHPRGARGESPLEAERLRRGRRQTSGSRSCARWHARAPVGMPTRRQQPRRRVVIVGGGFGGLDRRARAAARRRRRDARRPDAPPPVPAAALPGRRAAASPPVSAPRRSGRRVKRNSQHDGADGRGDRRSTPSDAS